MTQWIKKRGKVETPRSGYDPEQQSDDFYKDGIRHMHDLVRQTLAACQIPHKVLDLKAWMTDRSKVK